MIIMHREFWKYRKRLSVIAILLVLGAAAFGIESLVTWIWPPMTSAQAYKDGYATGFSTDGTTDFPFGRWTCVSAWNAEASGLAGNRSVDLWQVNGGWASLGFTSGGPPATRIITMRNQDTGTALGNAWMAGCRAGLAALGQGY